MSVVSEIKAAEKAMKELRIQAREKEILKRIDEKGLARVLAELVDNPTMFAINTSGTIERSQDNG